jgi:hypothetical protein
VRSDAVCHHADIAMRLGRKVRWDPVAEEFPGDADANRLLARPMRALARLEKEPPMSRTLATLALGAVVSVVARAEDLPAKALRIAPEDRRKVEAAIAEAAPARPREPRLVLVMNLNVRKGEVRTRRYPPATWPSSSWGRRRAGRT